MMSIMEERIASLVMKNFNDEYHGGEDSKLGDEEL